MSKLIKETLNYLEDRSPRKYMNEQADKIMADEIVIFIENDGDLYRQMVQPIIKNYQKKIAKGRFDQKLAVKGMMNLVAAGIRKYNKEISPLGNVSKQTKEMAAEALLDSFEEEIFDGVEGADSFGDL
jgi:hypothetical protein